MYTDNKPHVSTYLNGAPKKRYLVVDGIDVVGRAVMHYKPNLKGGHHHRRNYCICNQCGHWFRRNRCIHDYEFSDGPLRFCNRTCDEQAQWEASLEADVGGRYEAHYWDAAEDAEWKRKREERR